MWAVPLLNQLKSPLRRVQQEKRKQGAETTTKNAVVERGLGEDTTTVQHERSLRGAQRQFLYRRYYNGPALVRFSFPGSHHQRDQGTVSSSETKNPGQHEFNHEAAAKGRAQTGHRI